MVYSFNECFKITHRIEGGFKLTNDPIDPGGMTFAGISRRAWPDWKGWSLIDAGDVGSQLESLVQDFYWEMFWTKTGRKIAQTRAALLLYDCAVNMGVRKAVKIAQKVVGSKQDGDLGPKTQKAFQEFIVDDTTESLFCAEFSLKRVFVYNGICKADKRRKKDRYYSNMKYLCGWINRVEDITHEN